MSAHDQRFMPLKATQAFEKEFNNRTENELQKRMQLQNQQWGELHQGEVLWTQTIGNGTGEILGLNMRIFSDKRAKINHKHTLNYLKESGGIELKDAYKIIIPSPLNATPRVTGPRLQAFYMNEILDEIDTLIAHKGHHVPEDLIDKDLVPKELMSKQEGEELLKRLRVSPKQDQTFTKG